MKKLTFILVILSVPAFLFSDTNIKKDKMKGGVNTYSSQPFNIPRPISNAMYNNFSKKLQNHLDQNKNLAKTKKQSQKTKSKSMADMLRINNK